MKYLTPLLTAAMLSVTSLTACGQNEDKRMDIQQQTEQRFRLNPNPKEAYRIRIKINDAPGPLVLMHDMTIRYMARNCSYLISSRFEGATGHPTKRIKAPTRKISENEYETVFYKDAVLDEDYFGEGVCRWEVDGFGTSFKATGKDEETGFNVSDVMKNLLKEKKLVKYYWKGSYPYYLNDDGSIYSPESGGVTNFGTPPEKLDMYNDKQRQNLFTITVTLEEIE